MSNWTTQEEARPMAPRPWVRSDGSTVRTAEMLRELRAMYPPEVLHELHALLCQEPECARQREGAAMPRELTESRGR